MKTYLEKYVDACKIHGSGTEHGEDFKIVNKAHDTIIKNFRILIKDKNGKEMLRNLLDHEDVYVSSWTATLLIFDYPKECKKIIKSVAKEKSIWAGTMEIFYKEWRKHKIKKMY